MQDKERLSKHASYVHTNEIILLETRNKGQETVGQSCLVDRGSLAGF